MRDKSSHASVPSQKFVDEVSSDASGRKKVAHGGSRETLGYDLAPLTGLWNGRLQGGGFVSELLTQDTGLDNVPAR